MKFKMTPISQLTLMAQANFKIIHRNFIMFSFWVWNRERILKFISSNASVLFLEIPQNCSISSCFSVKMHFPLSYKKSEEGWMPLLCYRLCYVDHISCDLTLLSQKGTTIMYHFALFLKFSWLERKVKMTTPPTLIKENKISLILFWN